MFYFKTAPVDPMTVDLQQLERVRAFKSRIGVAGVYFSTFANRDQFSQQIRLHLSQAVQQWFPEKNVILPSAQPVSAIASRSALGSGEVPEEIELGFLDHLELCLQAFQLGTEAMERLGEANHEVGAAMHRRAEQMDALKGADGIVDPIAAKKIVLLSTQDLNHFASRLEADIPIFSKAYKDAMAHVTSAASLSIEDFTPDFAGLRNLRDVICSHEPQIDDAMEKLAELRDTTSKLPRVSGVFTQAKNRTAKTLASLWTEMDFTRKLNIDAVSLLNTLIAKEIKSIEGSSS